MEKRYHPLTDFSGIDDIVNRTIERFFSDFFPMRFKRPVSKELCPACDLIDYEDHLFLRAEVPGLNHEDLNISASKNSITLKGELKQRKEEKGETYYQSERSYGAFLRTIDLPTEIEPNKIDAVLKDGILEVKLPKKKTQIAKKIEIKIK
ncbi:Hsp20/alpha crystallin family protein [candidate division WOR-3 bacterium]|nr:Hsp20/alpha crystallin family protein [candidate division WOR-3 bacterium]